MFTNYSDQNKKIEIIRLKSDEAHSLQFGYSVMCFVVSGVVEVASKNIPKRNLDKEEVLMVPFHTPCLLYAQEDSIILKIMLLPNVIVDDKMPFMMMLDEFGVMKRDLDYGVLPSNPRITEFATTLISYTDEKLYSNELFDAQISLLLHIMKVFYNHKELTEFFSPIYSNDLEFTIKIYESLENVKNLKGLAKALNYSTSGFEKRFKKVFDVSPYEWLLEQKSKKIYHEIISTKKTFSELAYEYDFSSPAHFNNFCVRYFTITPGMLRRSVHEQEGNTQQTQCPLLYNNSGELCKKIM